MARSYVLFRLDPRAKFSDGTPITSADVAFTFAEGHEKRQQFFDHAFVFKFVSDFERKQGPEGKEHSYLKTHGRGTAGNHECGCNAVEIAI